MSQQVNNIYVDTDVLPLVLSFKSYEHIVLLKFLSIVINMIYKNPADFLYIMNGIKLNKNIIQYSRMCKTQKFTDFIGFQIFVSNQTDIIILRDIFKKNKFKIFGLQFNEIQGYSIVRVSMYSNLIPGLEYNQVINFDTYDTNM
jgi:hypothetical protein